VTDIVQSGSITPGHLVRWVTNGVVGDGGAGAAYQQVLASATQVDFNSTADQPIPLPSLLNYFQLTGILVAAASVSLTVAQGGFYPQASKGGTALVAASQVYTALTASSLLMNASLSTYAQQQYFSRSQLPDWSIYFSLTAAQGSIATASVYLLGIPLG